jgi:anti-sigma B factor antagonist
MSDVTKYRPVNFSCESQGENIRVVFPQRRITEDDNVEQLGEELFALVEQFRMKDVVVDFSAVNFVTSSVLGKLITLHRKAARYEGQLRLTGVQGELEQILRTSHLLDYFNVELGTQPS